MRRGFAGMKISGLFQVSLQGFLLVGAKII